MTPGRAILIKLIALYRELEYSLSKIEVQKLCYLAQCAGEPLKLDFEKNQFGPYAPKLRHVLTHIDGHYVQGVGDHDKAETELTLLPGAVDEANRFLLDHPDSLRRMEHVGQLIEGFETPYGMELLATVHWVATRMEPTQKRVDDPTPSPFCAGSIGFRWLARLRECLLGSVTGKSFEQGA